MKKFLLSTSVGLAALVASAVSASAATATVNCTVGDEPCTLGAVADPASPLDNSVIITINDVNRPAPATPLPTQSYTFSIGPDNIVTGISFTESSATTALQTLTLTGPTGGTTTCTGVLTSFCNLEFLGGIAPGAYTLTLTLAGVDPFTGIASFFFRPDGANEVPVPGALLLMGSVLMGGAGLAKWRKSSSRLAA